MAMKKRQLPLKKKKTNPKQYGPWSLFFAKTIHLIAIKQTRAVYNVSFTM